MGCNCGGGKRRNLVRTADGKQAKLAGYQITWPDGTQTPADQPIFSMIEARKMIRGRNGATVRPIYTPV